MAMCFRNRAFTLIEILITVIIVGILASIALTNFGMVTEKAHAQGGEQILFSLEMAQRRYALEHDNRMGAPFQNLGVNIKYQPTFSNLTMVYNPGTTKVMICLYRASSTPGEMATITYPPGFGVSGSSGAPGMYGLYTVLDVNSQGKPTVYCSSGSQHPGICEKLGY